MKRILPLLAFCAFGVLTAAAADTLLNEAAFQAPRKGFGFWQTKMTSDLSVSDGVVKIVFKTNDSEKPNLFNAQFIVPYGKGLKAGVKYRVEATVKSSAALRVKMAINLNKKPWTQLTAKDFNLKAGEATNLTLDFSPKADITENYRVPMFGLGLAQPGTTVEISNVKLFEVK